MSRFFFKVALSFYSRPSQCFIESQAFRDDDEYDNHHDRHVADAAAGLPQILDDGFDDDMEAHVVSSMSDDDDVEIAGDEIEYAYGYDRDKSMAWRMKMCNDGVGTNTRKGECEMAVSMHAHDDDAAGELCKAKFADGQLVNIPIFAIRSMAMFQW